MWHLAMGYQMIMPLKSEDMSYLIPKVTRKGRTNIKLESVSEKMNS